MQVYKFGGASVKDTQSVRNVFSILEKTEKKDILIVISAMGKTTNALEEVVESYFKDKNSSEQSLQKVKDFHYTIIDELFEDKNHPVYWKIDGLFGEITSFIERNTKNKEVGDDLSTDLIWYWC